MMTPVYFLSLKSIVVLLKITVYIPSVQLNILINPSRTLKESLLFSFTFFHTPLPRHPSELYSPDQQSLQKFL